MTISRHPIPHLLLAAELLALWGSFVAFTLSLPASTLRSEHTALVIAKSAAGFLWLVAMGVTSWQCCLYLIPGLDSYDTGRMALQVSVLWTVLLIGWRLLIHNELFPPAALGSLLEATVAAWLLLAINLCAVLMWLYFGGAVTWSSGLLPPACVLCAVEFGLVVCTVALVKPWERACTVQTCRALLLGLDNAGKTTLMTR